MTLEQIMMQYYGKIDEIIPCSKMSEEPVDQVILWHWKNSYMITRYDNLSKGAKVSSKAFQKEIHDKVTLQYRTEPSFAYNICVSVIKSIEYVLHDDEYLKKRKQYFNNRGHEDYDSFASLSFHFSFSTVA